MRNSVVVVVVVVVVVLVLEVFKDRMSKDDDIKEISTGCVLVREEKEGRKILLIERFDRGTYEIPKGHVEDYDKTLKMAAERELREVRRSFRVFPRFLEYTYFSI